MYHILNPPIYHILNPKPQLADPAILASRKAEEEASKQARLKAKEKAEEERRRTKEEKERRSAVPPSKMFLNDARFSSWDGDGFPTHASDGRELSGSQAKKLRKEMEKQAKMHAAYLDSDLGRNLTQAASVTDATE
jgi:cysteinyl-tRNA synthetase